MKVMGEKDNDVNEIDDLKKYLGKLIRTLAVANNREDRVSKISELKWLYEMEPNEHEKKILFIEIKSIMSSEVKVLADTGSEDEIIEKKSRIHYTPQSAIDLDRVPILLPSPILENWNFDNESYSLDLDSVPADDSSLSFDRYLNPSGCVSSMQSSEIQNADSSSCEIVESFEHLTNNFRPFSIKVAIKRQRKIISWCTI